MILQTLPSINSTNSAFIQHLIAAPGRKLINYQSTGSLSCSILTIWVKREDNSKYTIISKSIFVYFTFAYKSIRWFSISFGPLETLRDFTTCHALILGTIFRIARIVSSYPCCYYVRPWWGRQFWNQFQLWYQNMCKHDSIAHIYRNLGITSCIEQFSFLPAVTNRCFCHL